MKKGLVVLMTLFLLIPVSSQQDVIIKSFDQKFFIKDNGVVESIWKVTVRAEKKTEVLSFYLNFGTRSYVRDLIALGPKQQPLKTSLLSSESLPLFNIFPPVPLENEEFTFTVRFVIWEAVTFVGDAASFDFATGFLYPVETLDLLISAPPQTRITNYFPGGGEIFVYGNLPAAKWSITSVPAGKNLQIKLEFSRMTSQEADLLFGDALALMKNGDWQAALDKFEQARERYTLLGDKERTSECSQYTERLKDVLQAQDLASEAEGLLLQEKYSEALPKFRQAQKLFQRAGLEEESARLDATIEKCMKYETAAGWVLRAQDAERKKDYVSASGFYNNAARIYSELGDEKKTAEVKTKLENLKAPPYRLFILMGAGTIVFLVIIIILLAFLRRKPVSVPPVVQSVPSASSASTVQSAQEEDKKKREEKKIPQMTNCPFCGREIPKSSTVCPYCSGTLSESKEELLRRKEETQKTIDELEKSYISGLVSEEEYKKLRKKWVTVLADIEEKLISLEMKKGR